jgi:outer membrane protein OmpA-like peptidoglycan-associated protein
MGRVVLIFALIALLVSATVALKSCQNSVPAETKGRPADANSIVALRNGATLVAKPGTPGRELVDWLASKDPTHDFELGGRQFEGRSVEPSAEAKGRLTRLVAMLTANENVRIHIIGHSDRTGDPQADRTLSEARAHYVADALDDAGIARERISFEGRGGDQPIASNDTPAGRDRNQRVSIVLTRKGS